MLILAGLLLLLCLGAIWYFVRTDVADYAAFKLLTETADRQKRYRVWVLKSFLLFSGGSVICLALLGRLRALVTLPPEFRAFSEYLQAALGTRRLLGNGFVAGLVVTLLVGLIAGGVARAFIARKSKPSVAMKDVARESTPGALGDIEPLMPRNGQETAHTALLSLNAGLSEELFFRLLLPLLLTLLFGHAVLAFVLAALVFGMVHVYQGTVGVVTTTILGLGFTVLYLATGNLWIAVGAHIFFDMIGMVFRPMIARVITG
jgi:uncharacterized protein